MEEVRTEEVTSCALCGAAGEPLYEGLRDQWSGAPGSWGFCRCPGCGLVWLNPRPVPEDVPKVYTENYFTHQRVAEAKRRWSWRRKLRLGVLATAFGYEQCDPGRSWRWAGRLAGLFPPLKMYVGRGITFLRWLPPGRLLDVGCGNGGFLRAMRELGWEVQGVEPDPESARVAQREQGVPVVVGTLEQAKLRENSVDAITVRHVLEHVADPMALLRECHRVLRPGGQLAVVTPNIESLGHKVFRHSWRALETPRHFYLFNLKTLGLCSERVNLRVRTLRTIGLGKRLVWRESQTIQQRDGSGRKKLGAGAALLRAWAQTGWGAAGEELLLIGSKGGNG